MLRTSDSEARSYDSSLFKEMSSGTFSDPLNEKSEKPGKSSRSNKANKSPLLSCFPAVFSKISGAKKLANVPKKIQEDEPDASDVSDGVLASNFNAVINFSPEEIIPLKYSVDDDRLNDENLFSLAEGFTGETAKTHADTTQRLYRLRQLMIANSIDVYVIPSEDEHQSEYTAACDNRREYISGFSGSAGIAVVSLKQAVLATDSRYFLEAEKQLDSNWELLKQGTVDTFTWIQWAFQQLKGLKHKTLSVDPKLISLTSGNFLKKRCEETGCAFKPLYNNLIDEIWSNQPDRSLLPTYELSYKFTGESANKKIARIRETLEVENATGIIVTKLDEVAWTLNLRGSDFETSPLFFSYLIITQEEVKFYINPEKLPKHVESYLHVEINNLKIKSYSSFWIDLSALAINFENYYYILSTDVSYGLITKLSVVNYKLSNLIELLKSVKNPTEIYGMKLSQLKDGIALVRYFAWLEDALLVGRRLINEYQGALKLEYYKSLMVNYKGVSFPTISCSGANAASNHYEPSPTVNSPIDPSKVYLCDAGSQYLDGTTDITRTFHFTKPTQEEKTAYTAVLRGHVAVSRAQFPSTSTGALLDTLARAPLWEEGLDYGHGTGHGIGSFLSVHEGPIYFGRNVTFRARQVVSNEPGYYKDYEFGIRIESDLEVVKNKEAQDLKGRSFLRFEYLTMVPFHLNLIDKSKLTRFEIIWINKYHMHVRNTLTPYLMKLNDLRAAKWLYKETAAISL